MRNTGRDPYDMAVMMLRFARAFPGAVFGAVTGAVLAGGLAFAAPAAAEPADPTDLLNALESLGITDIAPDQAVALGQSLCPLLAERGQNTADIAARVADTIGRPIGPATAFTGTAISFLCPKAVDRLADGGPLLPLFG